MWINPRDLTPMEPETIVELPDGSRLLGMVIHGLGQPFMLGIREHAHGYPVSCAVVVVIVIDPLPVQRNHNRSNETGE